MRGSVTEPTRGPAVRRITLLMMLAFAVGLIHVFPDLRFFQDPRHRQSGIHLLGSIDEGYYLSRVARVLRGEARLANVGIYEHWDDPYLMPPLPELVEGSIGRFLRLSIRGTDVLCTFCYPAAIALLLYVWLGSCTASFGTRVVGALAIALGLVWLTPDAATLVKIWRDGFPLAFVRPISPSWHFLCLLGALILLFRSLERPAGSTVLWAGLAGGLVWYSNMYFVSFFLALVGVLCVGALARREWQAVRRLLLVLLCAGVLASPSFLTWSEARASPAFHDLWQRYGAVATRRPVIPLFHLLATTIVVVGFWPADRRRRWRMIACLLAGWLCLNQQLVTGWTMQPVHWQSLVNKPIALAGLVVTGGLLVSAWPLRWRRLAGTVAAAAVIGISWTIQERYYRLTVKGLAPRLSLGRPCQWLRARTVVDEVVLTNPLDFRQSEFVSTYGGNAVYFSDPFFISSLLSRWEIEHRYLAALRFYAYTPDEAQALFTAVGGGGLFVGYQVYAWAAHGAPAQQEYLQQLADRYRRVMRQDPIDALKPYRAIYALLSLADIERMRSRQPDAFDRLTPVYQDEGFTLYRIRSEEAGSRPRALTDQAPHHGRGPRASA
jgi:hypothetical protein